MPQHKKGDRALGPTVENPDLYRSPAIKPGRPRRYPGYFAVVVIPADDPARQVTKYRFTSPATEAARRAEAMKDVADFNAGAELAAGVTVENALLEYPERLRKVGDGRSKKKRKNGRRTIETKMGQLEHVFPAAAKLLPDGSLVPAKSDGPGKVIYPRALAVSDLDVPFCRRLYDLLRATPGARKTLPAADTVLNSWDAGRRFLDFCVERKWARSNPFLLVETDLSPADRNKGGKGKKQLGFDDLDKFVAKAYELAEEGDEGAVAALIALFLGIRASQIVAIKAKDIDLGGCILHVDHQTATKSTRKMNPVREERLSLLLLRLKGDKVGDEWAFPATGRVGRGRRQFTDTERKHILAEYSEAVGRREGKDVLAKYDIDAAMIFVWRRRPETAVPATLPALLPARPPIVTGHRDRSWVAAQVKRVCRLAGVPEDTHAHGMRGTSASLDTLDGRTLAEIQQRLSHRQGSAVTDDCYIADGAKSQGRQAKLGQILGGLRVLAGKKEG